MTVLPNLQQEIDTLKAIIAKQTEALAAASKPKAILMKVGEKGGLSVYGLGRFPVTLYRSQWDRLFGCEAQIKAFIATNGHLLKEKE